MVHSWVHVVSHISSLDPRSYVHMQDCNLAPLSWLVGVFHFLGEKQKIRNDPPTNTVVVDVYNVCSMCLCLTW